MTKNRLTPKLNKLGMSVFILFLSLFIPSLASAAIVLVGGGQTFTTITAAYASGTVNNGDTLQLTSNITDNIAFTSNSKNVNITSAAGNTYTITGTGSNPTILYQSNYAGGTATTNTNVI